MNVLFSFELPKDSLKGFLSVPDQGLMDILLDKIWTNQDSLSVDASSLNAGIIYKGKILPGDSVIDGLRGRAISLRLRLTNYAFTLKTNLTPVIEGFKIVKRNK